MCDGDATSVYRQALRRFQAVRLDPKSTLKPTWCLVCTNFSDAKFNRCDLSQVLYSVQWHSISTAMSPYCTSTHNHWHFVGRLSAGSWIVYMWHKSTCQAFCYRFGEIAEGLNFATIQAARQTDHCVALCDKRLRSVVMPCSVALLSRRDASVYS